MAKMKFLQGKNLSKFVIPAVAIVFFGVGLVSARFLPDSETAQVKTTSGAKLSGDKDSKTDPKPIDETTNSKPDEDENVCTINKNGQIEHIASSSVDISEKSSTGVDLSVDCKSSSSGSNSTSKVKTNIDVEVNSGN